MSDLEADLKEYASANGATKTKALVEKILAGGEAGPISPGKAAAVAVAKPSNPSARAPGKVPAHVPAGFDSAAKASAKDKTNAPGKVPAGADAKTSTALTSSQPSTGGNDKSEAPDKNPLTGEARIAEAFSSAGAKARALIKKNR